MGKYATVFIGVVAMAGGVWAIAATWPLFATVLTAVLPPLAVLGGFLAVLVGIGELRDRALDRKSNPPPSS